MTIEKRLLALERAAEAVEGGFAGWLDLAPGQRPIDALQGASKPGVYFLIDSGLNGPGYLGRVCANGSRNICFDGGNDAIA